MLRRYLQTLEDPLHPLLGPNLRALSSMGLWRPEKKFSGYIHDAISFLCLIFVCSQYVQLYFIWGNLSDVMENLSVSTVSTMAIIKITTFRLWHGRWERLIRAVSDIETLQRRGQSAEDRRVTDGYILHSRIVTYSFWTVVFLTINFVMANPIIVYASSPELRAGMRNGSAAYPQVFSAWLPVDASRPPRYWVTVALHAAAGWYVTGAFAAWDAAVVSVMVFHGGQQQLLRRRCRRWAGAEGELAANAAESRHRVAQCHLHHLFLLKHSRIFNSVISPVMFVYFVISSVMLCAIMVQITTPGSSLLQLVRMLEFLAATLIQLFLFYWHSNEVLFKSSLTEGGVYEGGWAGAGAGVGAAREAALLARGLRLPVVFSAGPFNDMTLATFVAILKAAYSYFTLLRARQQQP